MTGPREERSLGELFSELSQQTSTLIQQEIELARHEVTRSLTQVSRNSVLVGVGGAIAYAGFIVLLIGIGWALTIAGLEQWLAFVLVGAGVVLLGAALAWWAISQLRRASIVPEKTMRTMQENVRWAKEQTQ